MEKITKSVLKQIVVDIETALKPLESKYGCQIMYGGSNYSPSMANIKIKLLTTFNPPTSKKKNVSADEIKCGLAPYGTEVTVLGRSKNEKYIIIESKRTNYVAQDKASGKGYSIPFVMCLPATK